MWPSVVVLPSALIDIPSGISRSTVLKAALIDQLRKVTVMFMLLVLRHSVVVTVLFM